jgi:hypothetical protein
MSAGAEGERGFDFVAGAGVQRVEAGEDFGAANVGGDGAEVFQLVRRDARVRNMALAGGFPEAFDIDSDSFQAGCAGGPHHLRIRGDGGEDELRVHLVERTSRA